MSGSHSHDHDDDDHHHHEGDGHGHDHSDDLTPALQTYLYSQVDFDQIRTLNEAVPASGRAIVEKGWARRLEPEPELVSDADDPQLLMIVPFTGQVRLHALLLRAAPAAGAPRTLHLYANPADDFDFGVAAQLTPTETLTLPQAAALQEIPLKRARWGTTRAVGLFVEDNHGAGGDDDDDDDEADTRIAFLGFRGDWMRLVREPVQVLYEKAANPRDHPAAVGSGPLLGGGIGGRGT